MPSERRSITDSPWFWALLFSAMGAVLLTVMDQRYGLRQSGIERQAQARRLAPLHDATAPEPISAEELELEERISSEERLFLRLAPLRKLVLAAFLASAVMLAREQWRLRHAAREVV